MIGYDGKTLLHVLCENGHYQCVQLLISKNRNIDYSRVTEDKFKRTALHLAASKGFFAIIHLVTPAVDDKKNLIIDKQDAEGNTALHLACAEGAYGCVKSLLEKGADSNVYNKELFTPLHLAIKKKSASCVGRLMVSGANWKFTDYEGNSAKGLAIKIGNEEVIKKIESIEEEFIQNKKMKIKASLKKSSAPKTTEEANKVKDGVANDAKDSVVEDANDDDDLVNVGDIYEIDENPDTKKPKEKKAEISAQELNKDVARITTDINIKLSNPEIDQLSKNVSEVLNKMDENEKAARQGFDVVNSGIRVIDKKTSNVTTLIMESTK